MKKLLSNLIIIISLCTFIFFAYKIYNHIKEEKEQNKLNNNIIKSAIIINTETEEDENKLPIEVDFNSLKDKNKDIVAWIYSKDTEINYPIVQAKDNNYYLRRLIDGSYNIAGSLFIDYKNSNDFTDYNTIIYGHNMKNGTMFGTLTKYQKQEYYDEHKEMYLFTENKNYKIEIFAGYITSSDGELYDFQKKDTIREKLIETAIKKSTFKSEIKPLKEDKIITLSTCSYDFEDARYVLLGILNEI